MLSHVAIKALVCVLALSVASEAFTLGEVVDKAKAAMQPIKAEADKVIKEVVHAVHPVAAVKEDKAEHHVEPPKVDLPKVDVPMKIEPDTPKRVMDAMMQNLPPFIQSIFQESEKKMAEADKAIDQKFDEMRQNPQQHGGFFSILLLKRKPEQQPIEDQAPVEQINNNNKPMKSLILFKISPKKESEIDAPFNNLHLLGGGGHEEDIDQKFFKMREEQRAGEQHHMLGGGDDDFDRLHSMHGGMTGNMDGDVERRPQGPVMIPQVPFFNYFLNGKRPYLIPQNERPERTDSSEENDDEESPQRHHVPQTLILRPSTPSEQVKKCLMAHYMRVKASLYHRTVLFMLFMSGLVLGSLLVLLMALRNCRRRRAMRHFQGMMNVSAIDAKSFMSQAPPAYEQLTEKKPFSPPGEQSAVKSQFHAARSPSALVNSLAQAYRSRYTTLVNDKPVEGDNVSVSSLPNYDEHTAKAAGKNSTEHI